MKNTDRKIKNGPLDFHNEKFSLPWADTFILPSQRPLLCWDTSTQERAALHPWTVCARTRRNEGPAPSGTQ